MVCACSCTWIAFWAIVIYKFLDWLIRKPHLRGRLHRYILITGCDTGFGHEIAKRLDRNGYNVYAGCLTDLGEEILKKQCSSRLKVIRLNVADHESVLKAYEFVKADLPPERGLWGLVNNAGIGGMPGPSAWLQLSDYYEVLNVNLFGLIDMTTTFQPLIKKEKGRVVSTASVFGRHTLTGGVPYCISKYGVETFMDSLRRELREYGCTAHLIEPGFHKTNITDVNKISQVFQKGFDRLSPELKQEYGEEYVKKAKHLLVHEGFSKLWSERISDVVDAYENALLAIFPRARYVVGKDAKFLWLPIQWMPEWLGDWILHRVGREHRPVPAILKKTN